MWSNVTTFDHIFCGDSVRRIVMTGERYERAADGGRTEGAIVV